MDERLLTVAEIADKLDVHVETVRRWIRSGDLPATRSARKTGFRVRERDLQAFRDRFQTLGQVGKYRTAQRRSPLRRAS